MLAFLHNMLPYLPKEETSFPNIGSNQTETRAAVQNLNLFFKKAKLEMCLQYYLARVERTA